jgi:hypothetical protein
MEQTNIKPELQEKQVVTEPTAAPAPRPWVTPVFERVALGEALMNELGPGSDGFYGS